MTMFKRQKAHCEYCHCITYDDDRGNCSACGAPRADVDTEAWEFVKISEPVAETGGIIIHLQRQPHIQPEWY